MTKVTEEECLQPQFCRKLSGKMKDILAKATIIDVRTPNEYQQGHFPGALNIPLGEVSVRLSE